MYSMRAKGDPHMNVQVNGLIGLWILPVLVLPILGLILWFFLGPRGK